MWNPVRPTNQYLSAHTVGQAASSCQCLLKIFLPFVIAGWPQGCVSRYEVEQEEPVPPAAEQQRRARCTFSSGVKDTSIVFLPLLSV